MKVDRQTRREARRLMRLCVASGELDLPCVRKIATAIATSTYRLRGRLLWEFHRLAKLEFDRRTAQVASAAPLQDEVREGIRAELEHVYGAGLRMLFVEEPELIGGVRVLVGSDLYDDSVRSRLTLLERRLSSADGW